MISTLSSSSSSPLTTSTHKLENPIESQRKRYKHNMQSMPSNTHHPHFQLSKDNENNNNHHHQHQQQHEPKYISTGTSLHNTNNGTFTPITQTHSHEYLMMMGEETIINNNNNKLDIEMITEDKFFQPQQHIEKPKYEECPCGHLHGPGQSNHHDIHAVGLSDFPLLRGPD